LSCNHGGRSNSGTMTVASYPANARQMENLPRQRPLSQ
jgi:hypothetical protein